MVFEVKDGGIANGQRRRMGVGREHLRKVSKAASGEACLRGGERDPGGQDIAPLRWFSLLSRQV